MLKQQKAPMSLFVAAHVLAWLAFLFLIFWPNFYSGVSETATAPGEETAVVEERTSASLVEVNGYRIVFMLLIPVIVSGVALFSVYAEEKMGARIGFTVWAAAITLMLFAGLGAITIGIFYLPGALTLLVAAVIRERRRQAQKRPPRQREETWR
jgi:hypothetical protein